MGRQRPREKTEKRVSRLALLRLGKKLITNTTFLPLCFLLSRKLLIAIR